MQFALWTAIVGGLLVFMALAGSVLARLPLTGSMVYVAVGVAVSPAWLHLSALRPVESAHLLEHLTETVVLVSLFTAGLKLSAGLQDRRWLLPLRLASLSMVVTVLLIVTAGVLLLHLPVGAAVLLAGILAPTDPVLASDVQLAEPGDRDRLRFALTGEGGLNDGAAFPVVMLGLGLLGMRDIGAFGWRWLLVDVLWAVSAGLAVGALFGSLIGRLVLYLRLRHREATGLDDFLALGLVGLSYGVAVLIDAYGFLAVFAAGVALRRTEQRGSARSAANDANDATAPDGPAMTGASPDYLPAAARPATPSSDLSPATDPRHAPAFMAHAVLSFNEQIERIGEVAAVIVAGALLWAIDWRRVDWWFVALLLLVVRPVAVAVGLGGARASGLQRCLIGWFGIRGIGSLYYLNYAITHGLGADLAATIAAVTLAAVVASIVAHGISVTPLMRLYSRRPGGQG
ncbi:cation:proton antiporter [Derxia gummosa]|uniref:Cation:proton antiporter n=1 Tax=Derxia gummosa DSM 723 TaxID=1121388 RepID=A0A8B6X138_9BURK|nr:cation:proton antiporter [Derxia gummosa]